MKRSEILVLTAIVSGAFVTGVVWAPAFSDASKMKDFLEAGSYIATILACGVAVSALSSWRHQFRFTERFSRLSALKDAATDLHLYRGYLIAIQRVCDIRLRGESVDPSIAEDVEQRRLKLLDTFAAYRKAWTSAVAFLTRAEEADFPGLPDVFITLYIQRPDQIYLAAREAEDSGCQNEYYDVVRVFNSEAKDLYARTVSTLDALLSEKV